MSSQTIDIELLKAVRISRIIVVSLLYIKNPQSCVAAGIFIDRVYGTGSQHL
jgi:hypothetical protein